MPGNKIKLLIVDDEVDFLNSISRRLELRGFEVTKATNGTEAIEFAQEKEIDLALVDLKMPGLDGKQILQILKSEHKYIEVIILTGYGTLETAKECLKLGAFAYLLKPYELDELTLKLNNAYKTLLEKKFQNHKGEIEKNFQKVLENNPLPIFEEEKETGLW